ncbi:MAG: hypothetical protein HQ510_06320 [Candidatus Marinimicrobia bacterium]|nr:hypothetical protein [Candidatus Neomarinimicrobiota bacterium]
MNRVTLIILSLLFTGFSCKTSTTPQPADCDTGFLPCVDNITECCEVFCEEWFTHCGSDSTDCCFNCPPQFIPCENDTTTCCEVICDTGFHNCGDLLTTCCIDSTSHNFSWEIDTLGIYGSYLNDVEIVNEDNIWVVGIIDTDEGKYNAANWNGSDWELISIYSNTLELYSIYFFSENDIWVIGGGYPLKWDGETWTLYVLHNYGFNVVLENLWGTSSSNMFFVGWNGAILHYDGMNFTQMDTGTSVDLLSIHGSSNGEYVFATGYDDSGALGGHSVVLEYYNDIWLTIYSSDNYWPDNDSTGAVIGCYVYNDTTYFTRQGGLWKYNYLTEASSIIPADEIGMDGNHWWQIIVNDFNDIFMKGTSFSALHFNGNSWQREYSIADYYGWHGTHSERFDYHNNLLVMVGCFDCSFGRAVVIKGIR